jgi:hypothetical protein
MKLNLAQARGPLIRLWRHLLTYSTESSCVIMLRAIKLSMGGPAAVDEACRILTEKAVAVGETSVRAARGKWPLTMALAYRKTIRNNLRRLSR